MQYGKHVHASKIKIFKIYVQTRQTRYVDYRCGSWIMYALKYDIKIAL